MAALWFPDAIRVVQADNGSFTGGPPKTVLHSTEAQFGHGWATFQPGTHSHFEVAQHPNGAVRFRQFYPLDQPSRALQDGPGAVRTNRDHAIQVEMGYQAAHVDKVSDHFWSEVARLLRWIETNAGVDPDEWANFRAYPDVLKRPVRFSAAKWDKFNGTCGHQHVPENSHGDPGAIPVSMLHRKAAPKPDPTPPTLEELLEMKLTDKITIPGSYMQNPTTKPQEVTVEVLLRRMAEWAYVAAYGQTKAKS